MTATIELSTHEIRGLCQRYLGKSHDVCWPDTTKDVDNFQVISYKLKPTSDAPAGFLGRHQFLNVDIVLNDEHQRERTQKLRFFTKSAPVDVASRLEYLEEFGVFKKEIFVYREVLPQLQSIFPDVAPKCYYADNNLLVFENLGVQGYKMGAKRDGILNYEHLNCCLKGLAAMHASSIVYEERQGKSLTELWPVAVVENSYPLGISDDHVRRQNFLNAIEVFKEMIKTMPKYQQQVDVILEKLPQKMSIIYDLAQTSSKYRNCFSHGDLWANNVMFQYGKFGDTPIQCRFVDFQLARYAPPILDVMTVLTIPTSRRFRKQFLTELLNNYYRYMTEFLKRENLNIEHHISRAEFEASVEEYRICGLIESLLFSHLTVLPPESTQTLTGSTDGFSDFFSRKRVEICMAAFHSDQIYRERLTEMLEDFVDNFVLK